MPREDRFRAPRSLARALAEIARGAEPSRAREAEIRAALPAVLGDWLHRRLADVRLDGRDGACVLVMTDASAAREINALVREIAQQLRRRLGPAAPARIRAEAPAHRDSQPRRGAGLASFADRPLTAQALREVSDAGLRRRLARWAGVVLEE